MGFASTCISHITGNALFDASGIEAKFILKIGDTALKASEIMFHSIVSGSTPRGNPPPNYKSRIVHTHTFFIDSLGAIAFSKQPMAMIKNEGNFMLIPFQST